MGKITAWVVFSNLFFLICIRQQITAPSREDPNVMKQFLTPCSPGDADAIEKTWADVEGDQLIEPELVVADFMKAVSTARPTVNQKDLELQVQFTQDFGQEG
jgi:vacuolar protein-sorting-associated protein 4